jgi:hypothetical protein
LSRAAPERSGTGEMLWTLFVVLLVLWLLGFFAFHLFGGLIHLLLLAAVVVLVLGLLRKT